MTSIFNRIRFAIASYVVQFCYFIADEFDNDGKHDYLFVLDSTYGKEWEVPKIVSVDGVAYHIIETPLFDYEENVFTSLAERLDDNEKCFVEWECGMNIFRIPDAFVRHACDWQYPNRIAVA
jgi:hypothetical protein